MPLKWTLRKWLAVMQDVYQAAELRRRILEATGLDITPQSLARMMSKPPRALRVATIEAICTTFQCQLSDFCEVTPGRVHKRGVRSLYGRRARRPKHKNIADFPAPETFPLKNKPMRGGRRSNKQRSGN
ncbi:MAG: helix-turn-helix transcriptional regulator [Myxococcota bacterium]|nr:helix-turn-helix transcriptional regulator [Myxococcota bacterium]